MKQIPNIFTLLNLFFGCLAIIFILQPGIVLLTDAYGQQLLSMPEPIWLASLCIGVAAVIDFLDGFVARLFRSVSEMGKQLDSLADVVSFGVAPGMILYYFLKLSLAHEEAALDTPLLWLAPVLILPCAAAWRLARFNIDTSQSYTFKGLPVPAAGIFVASFPLIYWTGETWVKDLLLNKWFLYGITIFLSYLMVSTLPLMSLKFKDYTWKNNQPKFVLVIISVAAMALLQWLAIPLIVLVYVLLSLLFKNKIA